MDVISALTGLKTDWKDLAHHLGVPKSHSKVIQTSGSTHPLCEVIEYWIKTADPPSWKDLAVALEKCGEYRIAHNIKRKYEKVKLVIMCLA